MRRLSMNISAIAAACAAALLAGCNLAPVYKTPDLPVPETVSANAAPVQASEAALQQAQALQWLQSPQLRDVVAQRRGGQPSNGAGARSQQQTSRWLPAARGQPAAARAQCG